MAGDGDEGAADVVDVLAETAVVVLDCAGVGVDGEGDLDLAPGELALGADHPAEKLFCSRPFYSKGPLDARYDSFVTVACQCLSIFKRQN